MATTEVADVISLASCVKEATVYGVQVPGNLYGKSSNKMFKMLVLMNFSDNFNHFSVGRVRVSMCSVLVLHAFSLDAVR